MAEFSEIGDKAKASFEKALREDNADNAVFTLMYFGMNGKHWPDNDLINRVYDLGLTSTTIQDHVWCGLYKRAPNERLRSEIEKSILELLDNGHDPMTMLSGQSGRWKSGDLPVHLADAMIEAAITLFEKTGDADKIVNTASEVDDCCSVEMLREAEATVVESGDLKAIHKWYRGEITGQGPVFAMAQMMKDDMVFHSKENYKDKPIKVKWVYDAPELGGVAIYGSVMRTAKGEPLWWSDEETLGLHRIVTTIDWFNFVNMDKKPVNGMMPVPESVHDTGEWPWGKKMEKEGTLRELVNLIVERKMREADHSSGKKVPYGSSKHIRDLEKRIKELRTWQAKQKKGSEKRAHYTRLIQQLRAELASAHRTAEKKKAKK